MFKEVKCRICSVKSMVILSGLLLITICGYAQEPVWEWATAAGGSDDDRGYSITIDYAGNSYVTGYFEGTATFGSDSLTSSGPGDIFVAKIDAGGNWQWANKVGGSGSDIGKGITIDDAGNSYVTGYFWGTATFGSYTLTSSGNDIFVAKVDSGGTWQWATKAGGTEGDAGCAITIDYAGNSYVTGYFRETAIFGSYSITSNGGRDIFIAKMNADGNWQWATQAGGTGNDDGYSITIDNAGNTYVTGNFWGTATFGSYSIISSGYGDIFIAKVDSGGNWQWATQVGGSDDDRGYSITIDYAGNSYVTGYFEGTATFGSDSLTSSGYYDIFVAKIDAGGNWQWATEAGGIYYDTGYGITIDDSGNSYVTGYFMETATFGPYSLTSSGSYGCPDIFVAKMDADGSWQWVTQAGGSSDDIGIGIAIDDNGNSYVTGNFEDTATFGSYSLTSSGYEDIFVAKLNPPVSTNPEINPDAFSLSNYPNPFTTSTMINYILKRETYLHLEIYNLKGQLVETLLEGNIQAGDHTIEWDSHAMPSGVYFLKMKAGSEESIRKMILLR